MNSLGASAGVWATWGERSIEWLFTPVCLGSSHQHIIKEIHPTSGQSGWKYLRVTWMVWWTRWHRPAWFVDSSVFGEFETKSEENGKLTYSSGTFVGAFLAIKPAIGSTSSGQKLGDTSELSDAIYTTKLSLSRSSVAATSSFLSTSLTRLGGLQEDFLGGISLLPKLPI